MSRGQSVPDTRVLYLEQDEAAAAQIQSRLAAKSWCEGIIQREDPAQILKQLSELSPSCLLVSDNLREIDSVAFAEQVRKDHPNIPVILLAADGSEELASRAVSADITEYIQLTEDTDSHQTVVERVKEILSTEPTQTTGKPNRDWVEEFLDLFPGVVLTIDETGTYVDLLTGDEESLLYDEAKSLLGQRFDDVLPAETAQRFHTVVERVLRTGERERLEYQLDVQAGMRWFEAQVGPAETNVERDTVFWVARDITERKRRAREYEQIFNSVNDAIAIFHPETAAIVDVNTAYHEMVGYDSLERIQELGINGLSATDEGYTAERAEEIIRRVAEHEQPETVEWRVQRQNGDRIWVEVTITTAEISGVDRVLTIQRDITERKRRQQEYEQIFNGVQDGIAVIDPETHEIVDVNDTFCNMVGYDKERVFEMGISGLSATDEGYTRGRAEDLIDEVIKTGQTNSYEWMLQTSDGELRVIEVVGTTAEIGGELRYVSINRDITERKRRKREFEQIFNSVNDAIAVHDPETYEILETNETMCELTGYDESTLTEVGAEELVVAEPAADYGPEDITTIIDRVNAGEAVEPYEQVIETSDGEQIWLEVNLTRAEINGEDRILALSRDVTTRKQREREYEQIFDSVLDAICIIEPETMKLVDVNEPYLDMLRYDNLAEIQSQGIDGLSNTAHGFDRDRAERIHRRVAETGEAERTEWQAETSDGERLWMDIKIVPARVDGQSVNVVFHRDITDRKHRQQRLEVFNRVLRHNLRNEVDVINSRAEEIRMETDSDHAEHISNAADRLVEIGQRARSIDRILSKQTDTTRIKLVDCIRRAKKQVFRDNVELDVTVSVPERAELTTDSTILSAAIESALDNAVSHAKSTVEVDAWQLDHGWAIEISDDGPGLPQQELDVLEKGTEDDLRHSRGLDMWRLKWAVEKINGAFEFDTTEGTTVQITVPDQDYIRD